MLLRSPLVIAGLVAAPALADPDPERGAALAAQCAGCHAAGDGAAIPGFTSHAPDAFVEAMDAYRSGARAHIAMRMFAGTLDDSEIADLAAWLSEEDAP